MTPLFLKLLVTVAIMSFLIIHSYIYRGMRFTASFFILSFLWASLQVEVIVNVLNISDINKMLPLFVFNSITTFTSILLYIALIYISFYLADKIIGRMILFQDKIFPNLILTSLIMFSFMYLLEIIFINNISWMHESKHLIKLLDLSIRAKKSWFIYNIYFLSPLGLFYLTECSTLRNSNWKALFIFIIFIQYRINIFLINNSFFIVAIEENLLLFCLVILAFLNGLPFERGNIEEKIKNRKNLFTLAMKDIPLLLILFVLLAMLYIGLIVLGRPAFILPAIPIIFITLLAIRIIPFAIVFILSLLAIIWGKEKIFMPLLPVIIVFGFWIVNILKGKYINKVKLQI